jgi:hypothetical protein
MYWSSAIFRTGLTETSLKQEVLDHGTEIDVKLVNTNLPKLLF